MAYQALYRKWRPDGFEEVKGQEHIVTTLKNQITHDRIGHAYIFRGTRGTGKTTVARIFAKAVNCEHPLEDGSPCNECASCKAISSGSSLNVREIDAASNNGIDNIREIRDDVQYSPTEGKYKVYIIDEAHQIQGPAFNALLKTLEEPPSYVIFIMATTDSHKIPITILSRCQKYDFRRISIDTIYDRLMDLLNREGIEAEEKAIKYIAKTADGSMRDALSLLDQCISFYLGEKLTYDNVLEVLGVVDIDVFNRLTDEVVKGNTMAALEVIDEVVWQGRELTQFVTDYTWYMRNLMLIKVSDGVTDQLDLSSDNLESMKGVAQSVEMNALMRYIRIFSELSNNLRYAAQKRVALELAVIRLTTPQMEIDEDSILERIRSLEKKIEESGYDLSKEQWAALVENRKQEVAVKEETPSIDREEVLKRELTPAQYEDMGRIVESIKEIQRDEESQGVLGKGTMSMLRYASINVGADHSSIVLSFDHSTEGDMAYIRLSEEKNITTLRSLVGDRTGKDVQITCQQKNSLKEEDLHSINLSKINMTIREE
ncbi:MAG: DNA polymerase III subunit gamma/tau [Lachnospiraceae bacterium]|jgi:DNA polymerase-3 subunit gamma/tau|nr:DNA polymerase III subunit gamma/tau [Lachnospiraceae bacterium]